MWYNPLVMWLLRSPLRRTMDRTTLLLTYTGRKSGRALTFPISYGQTGDRVRLITGQQKTWWKNISGATPVSVWLRGERRTGVASLPTLSREARVAAMLDVYRGMPRRLADKQAETMVVVDIQLEPPDDGRQDRRRV